MVTHRRVSSLGYCDGIVFTSNQLLLQHFIFMRYCLHEWQKNKIVQIVSDHYCCIYLSSTSIHVYYYYSAHTQVLSSVCACAYVCVYILIHVCIA